MAWRRQPNPVSVDFPFTLIIGRVVNHFHVGTRTTRFDVLFRRTPHLSCVISVRANRKCDCWYTCLN
jgi:predicted molibdopterin-dependent oxidoreductase YjgC